VLQAKEDNETPKHTKKIAEYANFVVVIEKDGNVFRTKKRNPFVDTRNNNNTQDIIDPAKANRKINIC